MGYKVIIAEKPSVAAGIARIVGANQSRKEKANGYYEGNGYKVTWAFGHLVGLLSPEDMGFKSGELPMMPDEWRTEIKGGSGDMGATVRRQVKTIETLFKGADEIVVATDAGREGELIFRYIYEYLGCRTPFKRLWISSLTDEAIRDGMSNLQPGSAYDRLSDAAHARSEADWLVGFNASRALRLATGYKGILSLGRVQTPVLCMICERYDQNKNFVPVPYWQIKALVHKDMNNFDVISEKKYDNEDEARRATEAVQASKRMLVTKVERKEVKTQPPLLYDLTALQRAANTRLGLTADETLKVAQSLYEKKHMTYPRTGSRYIGDDVLRTIPSLIGKLESYGRFASAAKELKGKKLNRRSVDASKVTDHHALLPTENIPTGLTGNEKAIWEMVAARALEAFGEASVADRTSVQLDCAGVMFKATGSVIKYPGWKSVLGVSEAETEGRKEGDEDEPSGVLPPLAEGEILPAAKVEKVRKETKPLPIYTDSSLLGEMETCGKSIEDEELRESMKDIGLGTPATRAGIIETLITRKYVSRQAKKLIPTPLGAEIWKTVRGRRIADVRTSGEWERDLARVERGEARKSSFDEGIKAFTLEVIDDLKANCKPLDGVSASTEPPRSCPCCGKPLSVLKFNLLCDPEKGGCGLKIPREVAGKKLTSSALDALTGKGITGMISGFKSKSGKPFQARLKINKEERKVEFAFEDQKTTEMRGKRCPCCGKEMTDDKWRLTCGCGMTLYKSQCGVTLSEAQIDKLIAGETIKLKGMKSKAGKTFDAGVRIDKEQKKTVFVFDKNGKK